ncbi:hypothetical protein CAUPRSCDRAFT_13050 [Caulochytrium protostelioides]|uniref:Uncharacterized protein n=1 Tax=Caulochytrium protostelioides TaxID=1555241 RepID=A0A4P9WSR0_9FUNG|nr:hypothetical protein CAUPRSCDRAFT_13050 [Caulochytrium protostelioides]
MARRHDQFFPLELLAHFYRLLKAGLESKSMVIIHAIVVNSVKLMHLDLPGVHVVIPAWLDGFMYMIQSPWVLLPETTRCAAAQILLSFCDLPDHLFPDDIENTDDVRPEIWRRRAFEILLTLCNEEFVSSREVIPVVQNML